MTRSMLRLTVLLPRFEQRHRAVVHFWLPTSSSERIKNYVMVRMEPPPFDSKANFIPGSTARGHLQQQRYRLAQEQHGRCSLRVEGGDRREERHGGAVRRRQRKPTAALQAIHATAFPVPVHAPTNSYVPAGSGYFGFQSN